MACKLHVALNTDLRSVAFRLFKTRYFVSHPYFVVFKWWPMTEWNKSNFFSARKFRQQLKGRNEVVTLTLFSALHTRDVSHHMI